METMRATAPFGGRDFLAPVNSPFQIDITLCFDVSTVTGATWLHYLNLRATAFKPSDARAEAEAFLPRRDPHHSRDIRGQLCNLLLSPDNASTVMCQYFVIRRP
jgi:hypothetical protein